MLKLCLGTANFGFKYGFNKKKITNSELLKIMKIANNNDLYNIDTSFEYFNSHQILRKIVKKKTKITSKIILDKKSDFLSIKNKILDFNKNSPTKINSLLFHNQKDALQIRKVSLLKKLKSEGILRKIGVSVYDFSILKNILNLWTPDIIQIPINPFNLDFISRKFLKRVKSKKILIFVRSIFLQGILVNRSNNLDKKYEKNLNDWFNFCEKKSIHPVKACIDFCKSIKELDCLIIGVQDSEELKQIIKFFKQPLKMNSNLILNKKYKKIDLRKI